MLFLLGKFRRVARRIGGGWPIDTDTPAPLSSTQGAWLSHHCDGLLAQTNSYWLKVRVDRLCPDLSC